MSKDSPIKRKHVEYKTKLRIIENSHKEIVINMYNRV